MNAAEKKMRKVLLELETLDEYDPTVAEGCLTRCLVEHFVCSAGNKTKTYDIALAVDKANGVLAHPSLDAITADKVRSALAPLVEGSLLLLHQRLEGAGARARCNLGGLGGCEGLPGGGRG